MAAQVMLILLGLQKPENAPTPFAIECADTGSEAFRPGAVLNDGPFPEVNPASSRLESWATWYGHEPWQTGPEFWDNTGDWRSDATGFFESEASMSEATQAGLTRCSALVPTTAIERFPQAFSRFLVQLRKNFGGYRLSGAQFESPIGVVEDACSVVVSVELPPRSGCLEAFGVLTARAARDFRERSVLVSIGSSAGVIRAED